MIDTPRLSIGYLSEADADYTKALTDADTLGTLQALVARYAELAADAVPIVEAMTAEDFAAFRKGLKIERRGKFAGDAWAVRFGAILMPMPMMRITMIADQFKCPFGVAYHRLKELGKLYD